jgi:hypothetical protein
MYKLTGPTIIEKLKTVDDYKFILGYFNGKYNKGEEFNHLDLGVMELANHYGGEGQGDSYWNVIYFKDHDVYIKQDGYYQSYSGTEFYEEPYEVRPQEKTITVYQ